MSYPSFCTKPDHKTAYDIACQGGYEEWVQNISDIKAIQNGCYFDIKKAIRVKKFIETFCYIKPKTPMVLYEWQWKKIIAPLFGWMRKDGLRRFRQAYLSVPKKNGKSLICSSILLYLLRGDGQYNTEVYNTAWGKKQAATVFNAAAEMIRNSPVLRTQLEIIDSTKRIVYRAGASSINLLSREAGGNEGFNGSVVIDELHAFQNRILFDALRFAGIGRPQPLFIIITTAGNKREGVCYEQYSKVAKKILSGELVDDSYYVCIYEADKDDPIDSEETWKKANPSYGLSLDIDQFHKDAKLALTSKMQEMTFRRYRLNQWVSGNDKPWLNMECWDRCKPMRTAEELLGKSCIGGLDLSSVSDITAFSLIFEEDGYYDVLPFFWVPEDTALDRERRGEGLYMTWAKEGFIDLIPGNAIDYKQIRKKINELGDLYGIKEIALDRLFQGQSMCNDLMEDGFNIVPFGQGYASMSTPSKEFEALVLSSKLRHGDNPVLRWMASNAIATMDAAGCIKPDKSKSTDKIDGIVATIMAFGRHKAGGCDDSNDLSRAINERGLITL